jgi:hypothetical protein
MAQMYRKDLINAKLEVFPIFYLKPVIYCLPGSQNFYGFSYLFAEPKIDDTKINFEKFTDNFA